MASPERAQIRPLGPSDAALVVAARAGEMWAKEALFRRHGRLVNGLVFRIMGRDVDVDDIVQESFAQALASLHSLENPQMFASWLGGIVVRTAHKVLRRRRLLTRLGLRKHDPVDLEAVVGTSAPPEIVRELRAIYAALERLPPQLRIPLVLRRIEGLPLEEIATMTKTSLATVKRRIAQAEAEILQKDEP